jgi:hypothetical protein
MPATRNVVALKNKKKEAHRASHYEFIPSAWTCGKAFGKN